jgi:hypothetical protein
MAAVGGSILSRLLPEEFISFHRINKRLRQKADVETTRQHFMWIPRMTNDSKSVKTWARNIQETGAC